MYRVVCVVARWRECGTFEDANLHKKNDMIGDALFFFSVKRCRGLTLVLLLPAATGIGFIRL